MQTDYGKQPTCLIHYSFKNKTNIIKVTKCWLWIILKVRWTIDRQFSRCKWLLCNLSNLLQK